MRIDHALLAVRDLDEATRDFRERLGMNAQAGGVHPGMGTHNALVHLGTAYLELIAVNDPEPERARSFAQFLEAGDAPYTYAVAVSDLDAASRALRARGLTVGAPRDGSRLTPTGVLLRWRAADLQPGESRPGPDWPPLPFLIEWQANEASTGWLADRVGLAEHEAGWGSMHALFLAAPDPEELGAEYERLFGWERIPNMPVVALRTPGGDAVNRVLGAPPNVVIFRPAPNDDVEWRRTIGRAARDRIDRHGAGVLGMAIRVRSVDEVVAALARRGVRAVVHGEGRWALIEPADAHGMLIEMVQGGT